MKIASFYYIAYPDCSPADPLVAASEVYVEIAMEDGDATHFDSTYALTVCTTGFLERYLKTHSFFAIRSLIVVERFDDREIRNSLDAILPDIRELGVKKGN
jgi:hypothetical protein